ncbi:putative 50S ribosomal protein L21, partial [Cardiosporidium cionae]
ENIEFGTVLMVGSKDWTIIGKPTVPYALVRATIEQQTLAGEQISFKYKKHRRNSRFLRIRHWVTMIRINEIVVDTAIKAELPEVKPLRLLDLWANRWLNAEEKEGIQYKEDGESVIVADIYDGSEHQPGSYHRRGLSNCYRWYPDPYATHWQM